ncbi:MAG: nuclear transport factor 2 family protein [bacterium]|nr:nuclear transport factor 2 family protein [bacterium]
MSRIDAHIQDVIEQVTEYRDQGQWDKLMQYFTERAYIDDAALTHEQPGERSIENILSGWRRIIRDLYYGARHTLGAIRVERLSRKEVAAESDVEARYYTAKNGKRYVLKLTGKYVYTFRKVAGRWKIATMKLVVSNSTLSLVGA